MRRRGGGGGGGGGQVQRESLLTRAVNPVFAFVRLAEFEILCFLFFVIAFLFLKIWSVVGSPDLTSRPVYNQILVKKPGGDDF